MNYIDNALICKALGDPTRLQIFDILKSGRKCACKLLEAFDITQPTLSYHMKMLVDCGIVISEKEGKWNYYTLNDEILKSLTSFLQKECKKIFCDC